MQINQKIYNFAISLKNNSFETKLQKFAQFLLQKPYGKLNYNPKTPLTLEKEVIDYLTKDEMTFDFNSFDCITYIESALTLALCKTNSLKDLAVFSNNVISNLAKIRYYPSKTNCFLTRKHFPKTDWLEGNNTFFKEYTKYISNDFVVAKCTNNRLNFVFNHEPIKKYLNNVKKDELETIKKRLESKIKQLWPTNLTKTTISKVPYISIDNCIKNASSLYPAFPDIAIISIVRPNLDLTNSIGSHLNITHTGLGIKHNNQVYLYHASLDNKRTEKVLLHDYLSTFSDSPTIKGINVAKITSN